LIFGWIKRRRWRLEEAGGFEAGDGVWQALLAELNDAEELAGLEGVDGR
jgi:hypothetical protein